MDAPTAASAPATANIPVDLSAPTTAATNLPAETTPNAAMPTSPCNVCMQMQSRRPAWKQSGPSKTCVLCNKPYCRAHAAPANKAAGEDVCEIDHWTYYRKHPQRWVEGISPTLEAREANGLAVPL